MVSVGFAVVVEEKLIPVVPPPLWTQDHTRLLIVAPLAMAYEDDELRLKAIEPEERKPALWLPIMATGAGWLFWLE